MPRGIDLVDAILTPPVRLAHDGPAPRSVAERFWSRVEKAADGCWLWKGSRQGHPKGDGYGVCGVRVAKGRYTMALAHRVAFILTHGRAPRTEILHLCDVRLCVNPAHLSEGTHAENMRQCVERGRHVCGYMLWRKHRAAA